MVFQQKLDEAVEKNNSLLCVGLDPDLGQLPQRFRKTINPQFTYNKWIIDQTHDLVCCYKPNSAFYEARGSEGIAELKMTCDYIRGQHPEIPILLDFKRGDIGNTNEAYAQFAFEYLGVDAITLQPYQGGEALQPFLNYKEKGIFILCKTSNPGAGEFQDVVIKRRHAELDSASSIVSSQILKPFGFAQGLFEPERPQSRRPEYFEGQVQDDEMKLYQYVAHRVVSTWNKNNNCFLVVGATYPEELKKIRRIVGDMTILVPGVGSQEGDLEKTIKVGLTNKKRGLIINVSRGIIFSNDPRKEAVRLRDQINALRKK